MNWYYFRDKAAIRLHLRTCTVLLLAVNGMKLIVDGRYGLDLSKLRIATASRLMAAWKHWWMGVLVVYGAYRLLLVRFGD
jgi:hypothetical protein